jgi:RHS repeat-associated protein
MNLKKRQYWTTVDFETLGSVNAVTNFYEANALNQYTNIANIAGSTRPVYDLDGNMLSNGVWTYTWDAANQLTAACSNSLCVVSNAYDHVGRRVLKVTPTATHTYVYDGWNLIQETIQNQQATTTNHYVWGKDLSGTLQGAGGVGGLLAVSLNGAWYFPFYDNNGNVIAYVDESGSVVAEYVYDAFGGTIAQSGAMADALAHRFSTKYYDAETGLYCYGYRFYDPAMHRWLNRDPIDEEGGYNLYAFCGNDGVNRLDKLGLSDLTIILGPHINITEKIEGKKTGFFTGNADAVQSKTSIESQIVRPAIDDFNRKTNSRKCQLDINWVVSSYATPLSLEALRAAISSTGSGEPIIYSGHGYIENGEETRTILFVEKVNMQPGIFKARGKGYTWTSILTGIGNPGSSKRQTQDLYVFSCFSANLPEKVGHIRLHKGPASEYHSKSVMAVQFQKEFKELIKTICCEKR